MLLFVYSLGLGIPFIIASLLSGVFFKFVSNNKKFFFYLEKVAGMLIMIIGIMIFFDKFSLE
jgi:cytochrome c-type biogenesis protein